MELAGFTKLVGQKGPSNLQYSDKLVLSLKSKWMSFGKELKEVFGFKNNKEEVRADIFIKPVGKHYEIAYRFASDALYKVSFGKNGFGIRCYTAFKLYHMLEGVYVLVDKPERAAGGAIYAKFVYEEPVSK